MSLKTTVIVNDIKNLSDARYCAGMGVDMIGFKFSNGQPVEIPAEDIREIMGWLEGVQFIGEFENTDIDTINSICNNFGFQSAQVSENLTLEELSNIERDIILTVNFTAGETASLIETLKKYRSNSRYILLESKEEFDALENAVFLKQLTADYHVILGFGIESETVNTILSTIQPEGIALTGGEEDKPGQKDYDELANILEKLEEN